jgi:hypothetical protein
MDIDILTLSINSNGYIFAGTDMGVYRSVQTTAVGDFIKELPILFELCQNYPNPFNPKTTISYHIPKKNKVELTIYNLIGQKIVTLVNKKQVAGSYKVQWDATGFSTGVYYYQLKTEEFQQVKKLVLIK